MLRHENYKIYRKTWIELNYKILDVYNKQDIILHCARAIGLETKKNSIYFETEDVSNFLMDCIINDYRVDGKNMVSDTRTK